MPVGKFKDQPIEALAEDPRYVRWLLAQSWFREKYPTHYTLIVNNFAEPSETPEHNRLQAMFLQPSPLLDLADAIGLRPLRSRPPKPVFEHQGFDVCFAVIEVDNRCPGYSWYDAGSVGHWRDLAGPGRTERKARVYVELKPAVSDDFPAILRQVKAAMKMHDIREHVVVLCDEFHASGASFDQVKAMFQSSGITFLRLDELRARGNSGV